MLATGQMVESQAPSNYPKPGETPISPDSTPLVILPSSLHTGIRILQTHHKNWSFYSRKQISPISLLKLAVSATARRAIRGLLNSSHSHSLKGRHSPYLLRDMQPESTS